jgi:hypothetical protein
MNMQVSFENSSSFSVGFPKSINLEEVESLSCMTWKELYHTAQNKGLPYYLMSVVSIENTHKESKLANPFRYFLYDGTLLKKYLISNEEIKDPSTRQEIINIYEFCIPCIIAKLSEKGYSLEQCEINSSISLKLSSLQNKVAEINVGKIKGDKTLHEKKEFLTNLFRQSLNPYPQNEDQLKTIAKARL